MKVETLESACIAAHVAAMPELRIEVVQIHKNESPLEVLQDLERSEHRLFIVRHPDARGDPPAVEDIADLYDCIYPNAGRRQPVQDVRGRVERVIAAIRRTNERSRRAHEGASNHTIDLVRRSQHRASPLAPVVERVEWSHVLVRRDL